MKAKKFTLTFFLILFIFPWFVSSAENYYVIPEVSQQGNEFYEINPCKVSLFEFIKSNPKSIYQDHYYFRPVDNSSINCYGRIAGVTVQQLGLETQFFVAVGTNSFLNLILQSAFWLFCITLIPKNKEKKNLTNNLFYEEVLIFITSLILSFSIYSQSRFYDTSFYFFEFKDKNSYILLFLIFWLITKNLVNIFVNRIENIINYLPFIFIFTFIFSGFNLNLYSFLVIFFGLKQIITRKELIKFNLFYLVFSVWWLFNTNGSFYFKVGKLRSFTSSSFDFNSNFYWIIFFVLLINGVYEIFRLTSENFNFSKFTNNISISTSALLIFGLLGSNFPIISFFQYYYLGLQRYVVNITNPFIFDEYGVKVSWRGIFPSSETVGELFGISLVLILYQIVITKRVKLINKLGIISSGIGLYFSDNKTSIVLVFLIAISYIFLDNLDFSKTTRIVVVLSFIFISIAALYFVIGKDNLSTSYEFMNTRLIEKAEFYSSDNMYSSSLSYIQESDSKDSIFKLVFGIISTISLLLNRSEMWGVFFARYNPNIVEFFAGSGPLNFGQLYGEIVIANQSTLLLPHSSVLSYLVFFGIIPIFFFLVKYLFELYKISKDREYFYLLIFLFFNILKNDSLNYFNTFIFYYLVLMIFKFSTNKTN